MLHTSNPIIKHKAGLLNLAEELGNVSRACKVMGVSRDTFYRYQELVETGGIDALIKRSRRTVLIVKLSKPLSNTPSISLLMDKLERVMNYVNWECLSLQVAYAQSGFAMT